MVAQKFGKADPDIRKGSKEKTDRPGLKASARTSTTGQIGGISNRAVPPSARKGGGGFGSFKRGGKVKK
jgi:hypothetical protein